MKAAELEAVERRLGGAPERLRTELKAHCLGLLNQTKAELMQARLAPALPPSVRRPFGASQTLPGGSGDLAPVPMALNCPRGRRALRPTALFVR